MKNLAKGIVHAKTCRPFEVICTRQTGGRDQVWSYAGQLSIAANVDFSQLIKTPGLAAYAGISWRTGSNLAGSLDSPLLTPGLYAPTYETDPCRVVF